ncbi:hypothetical protein AHF37_10861 [Paragonimus kellicotti]|nr:hypothetical protein AHF37_10861 [Paragonimus kellicotti]
MHYSPIHSSNYAPKNIDHILPLIFLRMYTISRERYYGATATHQRNLIELTQVFVRFQSLHIVYNARCVHG